MLPYFELFNVKLPLFNLLIGIGAIVGILLFYKISENKISKEDTDNIIMLLVISIFIGFLSGMLFDKIVHFKSLCDFRQNLFKYTGITFLGGFLGGIISFCIVYKLAFKSYRNLSMHLDIIAPAFTLAQGIGRIGCLAGGCCFGKPCEFGLKYPIYAEAYKLYGNVRIFPLPLAESLFLIILTYILLKKIHHSKALFYMLSYGLFRFFIEYFRGDNRGMYLFDMFSPSQCICIILISVSAAMIKIKQNRMKKQVFLIIK